MSGTITLRGVCLGAGAAKIAAPLVGTTPDELWQEAEAVARAGVDVAEWRADHLMAARGAVTPPPDLARILAGLRTRLGDIPLLATVRTSAEGGAVEISDADLTAVLTALLDSATDDDARPDAVDVELARTATLAAVLPRARRAGTAVVVSAHNFAATPDRGAMVTHLEAMAAAGGDVVKLAVTAQAPSDVLELLAATLEASRRVRRPVITMSMGPAGVVSRLAGEVFGSALTFGSVLAPSAPGQVEVSRLRDAVLLVHESGQTAADTAAPPATRAPAKDAP